MGFPGGKESASHCRRHGRPRFNPWRIPWRKTWQPTPAFLPEKSHGQRSLPSYSPWGHRESGVTERAHHVSTVVYLLSIPHLSSIAPIDRLPASTIASAPPFPVLKLENTCWTGSPESSSWRHVGLRDIDVLVLVQDMTPVRPWEVGCQVRVTGAPLLQPSLQ